MRNLVLAILNLLSFCLSGQSGKALCLDGSGDFMRVPHHHDFNIDIAESMSITCWIKGNTPTNSPRIISKSAIVATYPPGYEIWIRPPGGEMDMWLATLSVPTVAPPPGTKNLCDGNWHHLAMVVDAAEGRSSIYVDGALESTTTSPIIGTQSFGNNLNLNIGASSTGSHSWKGWIDEVRFWSFPLDEVMIQADMTSAVDSTDAGLIAAWTFEEVQGSSVVEVLGQHPGTLDGDARVLDQTANMTVTQIIRVHPDDPCGRGNKDERLVSVNLKAFCDNNPLQLTNIKFSINSPEAADNLTNFRLWSSGSNELLDMSTAEDLGEGALVQDVVSFSLSKNLEVSDNIFWLTANIRNDAPEGLLIGAQPVAFTANGLERTLQPETSINTRTVLLEHKNLFSNGDFGYKFYRIPAILSQGKNVVAVADAQRNSNNDLPNEINILARTSLDMGQTWSAPVIVSNWVPRNSNAALSYNRITGKLLCLYSHDRALFDSHPSDRTEFWVSESLDMGRSWSYNPEEYTSYIYEWGWYGSRITSGNAHQLDNGDIVAAIEVRENSSNTVSNYVIRSVGNGIYWEILPGRASPAGGEAKLVSLDNNDLLMSISSPGGRKFTRSHDGGATWDSPALQPELVEPGVNGDLIRYTSVKKGYDKSRLLTSLPDNATSNRNLTVFISYDEGNSWPVKKVICPGPSAVSSLTTFEDGSIGIFYENREVLQNRLCFARFSLDWLSSGTDTWSQPLNGTEPEVFDGFSVSPVPSSGNISITLPPVPGEEVRIEMLDYAGKTVKTQFEKTSTEIHVVNWNTAFLPPGSYFVRLTTSKGVATRKAILCK